MARPYYILEKDEQIKVIYSTEIQPYLDQGYKNIRKATEEETAVAIKSIKSIEFEQSKEIQNESIEIETSQAHEIETSIEKKEPEVKIEVKKPIKKTTLGTKRKTTKKP